MLTKKGPAVYTARALLRGLDPLRQEYMHECEKVYPNALSNRQSELKISNNIVKVSEEDNYVTPNPAKNLIKVRNNGEFSNISIEEINGKIVLLQQLNQNLIAEQIDVSFLTNGLYLVKLKTENRITIIKLVINK
ncbi:MAG TPA: T9SS type A sorting domain-containing protein [Bacteroidia bacterium]|nr:T9SS type A sorting domain-containing protein [Bacteroidia bacterium]